MNKDKDQVPNEVFDEMKDVVDNMRKKKATLTYLASKIPESNFE